MTFPILHPDPALSLTILTPPELFYRYEQVNYAPSVDEFGYSEPGTGRVEVRLRAYKVLSHTRCGVWIDTWDGKRFVNLQAVKQFANATKEEALNAFICRKRAQIRICEAQIRSYEKALDKALDLK